jgi:hypothetical protein
VGETILVEACWWSFLHFAHLDHANAAVHCSPWRYSPITFNLAKALEDHIPRGDDALLDDVIAHFGTYPPDRGRIELDPQEETP